MQYPGRDQNLRMGDPVRAAGDERRALPRRIDCDDSGRARRAVNPDAVSRTPGALQAGAARRRLDID